MRQLESINVATVQAPEIRGSAILTPVMRALGSSIVIDDVVGGSWYALNGDANGWRGVT